MLNTFNKKIISPIKEKLKKKIEGRSNLNLFFRAIIHFFLYLVSSNFRKKKYLVDPPSEFFYKYIKLINYFSFLLIGVARYLKKKKIFISINNENNNSIGHVYAEIGLIKKIQHTDDNYSSSKILFLTSKKEILVGTRDIFETKNFKILFGGLKRIFFTFVAIKDPSVSIDGSVGHSNYYLGRKYSHRFCYNNLTKRRSKFMSNNGNFFPNKDKLSNYCEEKSYLLQKLNISKKYIIIQIKTSNINGTLKPYNPNLLLKTIKYFQHKDYQIVFAGREKLPDDFLKKSIINYANSKYTSPLNDLLLVEGCSFVICSGSGFSEIPYSLDKPLLIFNVHHISQYFGNRTILLPTLLSRRHKKFNAKLQHLYLCTYGPTCGYNKFDDFYIHHMPTSEEVFMAAKEIEEMMSDNIPPFTTLQKKIHDNNSFQLLYYGLSRISNFFLTKHAYFFEE